jgi:type IV pili sensor histidine kinase/response regulator
MVLDAASLEAITQEIRNCFVYEDAPDHLAILEQGISQLRSSNDSTNLQAEYADLMRAAHSLKGGAGIAQLLTLSRLAHKLEDLLEAIALHRVQEQETAYELLSLSVEQISDLIAEATSGKEGAVAVVAETNLLPTIAALENFLQSLPSTTRNSGLGSQGNFQASDLDPYFLKTALEVDLENCLQKVERLLYSPEKTLSVQPADWHQALTALVQECTFLGQALNLAWLSDTANLVTEALTQANLPIEKIAETAITEIRQLRAQVLTQAPQFSVSPLASSTVTRLALLVQGQPQAAVTTDEDASKAASLGAIQASQGIRSLNLGIPVSRLDRMNNTIGELFISYERLSLYQEQLHLVDLALKKRAAQLNPIAEQVQAFYDRLATDDAYPRKTQESEVSIQNGIILNSEYRIQNLSSDAGSEFDPLEFDRYAELHSTLQDFQELMVQVQEARADVQLISSEFREALVQLRQQLNELHGDLTESRLVPFGLLTKQFVVAGQTFSQRYKKSVNLVVIGKETPLDRVIVEQLKFPLTHLFRNAFDHGIETPEERQELGKSPTAQIALSATVQGNTIAIAISDDGRGIDIQTVYQRAVEIGLCGENLAELSKEQILEFLFTPGFSTTSTITDLSGRGVGLDIVRLQVERLRGSVSVESSPGQGTKFTISIPLTLNILPLLLCRCQQQTLAIPSTQVLEIIALSEYCDSIPQAGAITWRERTVPLYPLMQLLPYRQQGIVRPSPQLNPPLGIILDVDSELVAIAVDSLVAERELVLKPFEPTVKVPAYVLGCTVLGTGEVIPVLSPDRFSELIARAKIAMSASNQVQRSKVNGLNPHSDNISKILIVDDSIAFRKLLDRVLSQSGYQVVQCRDGKEALEKLNQPGELFDLVISDIEMPRLDGFALLKEIRSAPQWHSLPVVILTSRENHRHRQKAMRLGATGYFTKPFRPNELLQEIAALKA